MRVAACLSKDEFLLKVYRDGRDLHSEVAIAMYGEDFTKEQRVHCKMFNFSYLYGGTEHSFATDSGLPISVARDFVQRYNNVMSGLAEFRKQQLQTLRKQGYVESPFGRRRRFPMITRINVDDARKASVHAPVAGTASDLTLISLIRTQEWIDEQGLEDVKQVITVHDSNILIVPKDMQEWVGRSVQRIMVETASEFFPEIPWKVDVEAGPDWGHIKDIFK
jgi:DNA polymerase-1